MNKTNNEEITHKYEEYQTARVEGLIPAEWEFENYLLSEVKMLRELLYAIHWDAFSEDDTTLEIDRDVAEKIRSWWWR